MIKDCAMLQDAKRQIVIRKLLYLCPQDLAEYVFLKNPSTMLEPAIVIQEQLDARPIKRKEDHHYQNHHPQECGTGGSVEEGRPSHHLVEARSGEISKLSKDHSGAKDY